MDVNAPLNISLDGERETEPHTRRSRRQQGMDPELSIQDTLPACYTTRTLQQTEFCNNCNVPVTPLTEQESTDDYSSEDSAMSLDSLSAILGSDIETLTAAMELLEIASSVESSLKHLLWEVSWRYRRP